MGTGTRDTAIIDNDLKLFSVLCCIIRIVFLAGCGTRQTSLSLYYYNLLLALTTGYSYPV